METVKIITYVVIAVCLLYYIVSKDDTDASFFKRSGLHLYTDYKTGLQYLGDGRGAIIPRLDENGKQMKIKSP